MTPKIVSIFNNKGGVGKTTYMFHVASLLADEGKSVLMVDMDAQCNLSAYCLTDSELERSWSPRGNSIWRAVEDVYRGIGDIRKRQPSEIGDYPVPLHLIPGDILLSNFEDSLGDSWSSAKGGAEPALRVQTALYRYIHFVAMKTKADIVMVDLGPNLGALNRAVLGASDYFIVPMSPDLFSIRGTLNLGNKLLLWNKEWQQCREAWKGDGLILPSGKPKFLGYVMQQHNVRQSASGMTQGWSIFGDQIENAVYENIVQKLSPIGQTIEWDDDNWNLGKIPNLHSLIPYSQDARKPVFECTADDGLRGAHISKAKDSKELFMPIVGVLLDVI